MIKNRRVKVERSLLTDTVHEYFIEMHEDWIDGVAIRSFILWDRIFGFRNEEVEISEGRLADDIYTCAFSVDRADWPKLLLKESKNELADYIRSLGEGADNNMTNFQNWVKLSCQKPSQNKL